MNGTHILTIILVSALVTALIRFAPFVIFGRKDKPPAFLSYLAGVLPYAVMAMLVVYCLRGIDLLHAPFGLPEVISASVVVGLHLWKRNTLLSIAAGTVCYMILIQLVF